VEVEAAGASGLGARWRAVLLNSHAVSQQAARASVARRATPRGGLPRRVLAVCDTRSRQGLDRGDGDGEAD
jgi:hypothetical protein